MTTLTCSCGSRLNIRGMPPGKSGLCPSCGEPVRVPAAQGGAGAFPTRPGVDSEWDWEGIYEVEEPPPPPKPVPDPTPAPDWNRDHEPAAVPAPEAVCRPSPSRPAGPARLAPGPWWIPQLLYPARGLEAVVTVVAVGTVVWVLASLIPEYCLALVADGEKSGTPSMGILVSLITATPFLLTGPLILTYWLQYLARVIGSAAAGEVDPPRPPDRDLDGLLAGLNRWFAWVVLGLGVGLIPLAVGSQAGIHDPARLLVLGGVGFPYITMALLLSFLHDEDLAARPWRVVAALIRVAPSFLFLTILTAWLVGSTGVVGYLTFQLRARSFGAYLLVTLPAWYLIVWMSIVTMHMLGAYYHAQRRRLRWRRPAAWWN